MWKPLPRCLYFGDLLSDMHLQINSDLSFSLFNGQSFWFGSFGCGSSIVGYMDFSVFIDIFSVFFQKVSNSSSREVCFTFRKSCLPQQKSANWFRFKAARLFNLFMLSNEWPSIKSVRMSTGIPKLNFLQTYFSNGACDPDAEREKERERRIAMIG